MRKLITILYIVAATVPGLRAGAAVHVVPDSLSAGADKLTDRLLDAAQKLSDADYEGARTDLRSLVLADSTMDAAWYYLGVSSYYLGDAAAAEEGLSRAAAIDTSNNWYLESLAQFYSSASRASEAGELYLKLMERDPRRYTNPYTLTMIAERCFSLDNSQGAQSYYEQALLFDENYIPALLGLADVLRFKGDNAGCLDVVTRFATFPEVSPESKCRYVSTLISSMDRRVLEELSAQVLTLTQTLVDTHPDALVAYRTDLSVKLYYGMLPEAIDRCCDMIVFFPDDKDNAVECYSVIGDALFQLDDPKGAYSAYENALKLNPRCLPVLNNYAYYLATQGKKLRKALRMSRITIEDDPDNATYLDTCGWILHLLGRDAQAKPLFKHAMLYGAKSSPVVLLHYSIVLEALGENDLARYYRGLAESK